MLLSLVRGFERDNFQRIEGHNINGKEYKWPTLIDLSLCEKSVKIEELKILLKKIVEGNEMAMKADIYLILDQINTWQSV